MENINVVDFIKQGSKARLIPVVADSKKEERATSVLLSSFMIIPSYAEAVLSEAGAKISKRSTIKCYTEIVFSDKTLDKCRPDGLIVITSGSKSWSALVEAKVGNNNLSQEQIEKYLEIAKSVGADALITISNQFATLSTHHPVPISKSKKKSVELYHFSWMLLLSKAVVMSHNKSIADLEQAFVLKELVRYLDHPSTGISPINSMGVKWKNICDSVQQGAAILRNSEDALEAVKSWHQLFRYLSIELSMATGSRVDVVLNRSHAKKPEERLKTDIQNLIGEHSLSGELHIPNAASTILVVADLARRTVIVSMRLNTPSDRSRPTAAINWFTKQLKNKDVIINPLVRAVWPGRIPDTQDTFDNVVENPALLVPNGMKDIPKCIEVLSIYDLGAKFKGSKVFVDSIIEIVPSFYKDIGENLSKWVPSAPKVMPDPIPENEGGIKEVVIDSVSDNYVESNVSLVSDTYTSSENE